MARRKCRRKKLLRYGPDYRAAQKALEELYFCGWIETTATSKVLLKREKSSGQFGEQFQREIEFYLPGKKIVRMTVSTGNSFRGWEVWDGVQVISQDEMLTLNRKAAPTNRPAELWTTAMH